MMKRLVFFIVLIFGYNCAQAGEQKNVQAVYEQCGKLYLVTFPIAGFAPRRALGAELIAFKRECETLHGCWCWLTEEEKKLVAVLVPDLYKTK